MDCSLKSFILDGVPRSVIYGTRVHQVVYGLIKHHVKGRYRTIVDPTCGKANRMFSPIVKYLRGWGIEYKACDKRPDNWAGKVCDVFKPETLPRGEVFVYDPPYLPVKPRKDERGDDYGIKEPVSFEDVKRFYSAEVFRNFEKRGAKMIIVKGTDFHYPPDSDRLVSFLRDILQVPKGWRITHIYIYRFFSLINHMLAKRIRRLGLKRPVIVHTYFVILEKEEPPKR